MTDSAVKVVIVDDSAFARKVLRETLSEREGFSVVAYARDGLEALELVAEHRPDVVTLDLMMPNLDGLGVLQAMRDLAKPPAVVVVSTSAADTALGIAALELGAFDLVHKPTALATPRLYDVAGELRVKLLAAAQYARSASARPRDPRPLPPARHEPSPARIATTRSIVVIGASTGGPPALTRLLSALPAAFPVPIAIALHIPSGYTMALADRLSQLCALAVVEAKDGMPLTAGMVALAPGGEHLRLKAEGDRWVARVSRQPEDVLHKPSVDILFESVASAGAAAIAAVLTGMGDDGLRGARILKSGGATILTEAEESCVVYGMPRSIWEAGLAAQQAPIGRMADLIMESL